MKYKFQRNYKRFKERKRNGLIPVFEMEKKKERNKRSIKLQIGFQIFSLILFTEVGLFAQEKPIAVDSKPVEKPKKEFYEDNDTGLIYTKTGSKSY